MELWNCVIPWESHTFLFDYLCVCHVCGVVCVIGVLYVCGWCVGVDERCVCGVVYPTC